MDIKEIAKRIRKTNNSYMLSMSPDIAYEFAEALIESYKAELLKEVGEPVAHMIEHKGKCMGFLPTKEQGTIPVFTSDQLAAAIIKATKQLEDQLAAAQDQVAAMEERLERQRSYFDAHQNILMDEIETAEQRVAEACACTCENVRVRVEIDSAMHAADAIRQGEWRKFVNEV